MQKPNLQQFNKLFQDDATWGERRVIQFRWFLILVILLFIGYIYTSGYQERALISLLLASIYIFYNSILNLLLKKYCNATWIRFLSATFDITILSFHIFNYSYFFQPIAVATAASIFLYPILIMLAVLRYDGRLVIFSTFYSIVCFNAIYYIRLPHISPELIDQVASANWAGQMYKSSYLLLMGYFLFSIPKMVKRIVNKQLATIQQQNSVRLDLALEKQKKSLILQQLKKEKTLNLKLKEQREIIEKQKKILEEAIGIKNKLFSIIGHDLKSPFAAQTSIIDLLLADYNSYSKEDIVAIMKSIKRSSHQGLELLNNILDWSKQQNNLIEPNKKIIFINDVVGNTLSQLHQHLNHKRISIHLFVEPKARVVADANILSTILRNLISNAIKFSYPDSQIKIFTKEENNQIIIGITDSGIGMNENQINQLFKPNKTSSTPGTQNEPGTGLGLFLCKDLSQMIDARIGVNSQKGKGSTFTIAFPAIQIPVSQL